MIKLTSVLIFIYLVVFITALFWMGGYNFERNEVGAIWLYCIGTFPAIVACGFYALKKVGQYTLRG